MNITHAIQHYGHRLSVNAALLYLHDSICHGPSLKASFYILFRTSPDVTHFTGFFSCFYSQLLVLRRGSASGISFESCLCLIGDCISLLARGEFCKSGVMLMSCSWMFAKLHWLDCLSSYNGSSIRAHQELAGSPGSVDSMLSAYKMDLSLPMRMRCWAASSTLGWKLVLSTNVSPLSR